MPICSGRFVNLLFEKDKYRKFLNSSISFGSIDILFLFKFRLMSFCRQKSYFGNSDKLFLSRFIPWIFVHFSKLLTELKLLSARSKYIKFAHMFCGNYIRLILSNLKQNYLMKRNPPMEIFKLFGKYLWALYFQRCPIS